MTNEKQSTPIGKIRLENVRLAFPSIWQKTTVNGEGTPAYRAAFIIPRNHPQLKKIQSVINAVATAKWKDKAPALLKKLNSQGRGGLQDGDLKEHLDGYAGNLYINANSSKIRPDIRDRDKSILSEDDNKPDGGDYVNATIDFWAMDNKHGQRVCASLLGIQFYKSGPRFAAGSMPSEDDFEDLGDIGADEEDNSDVA